MFLHAVCLPRKSCSIPVESPQFQAAAPRREQRQSRRMAPARFPPHTDTVFAYLETFSITGPGAIAAAGAAMQRRAVGNAEDHLAADLCSKKMQSFQCSNFAASLLDFAAQDVASA
jgi:hypothetical protein